jgi:protein-S-isoprenylcysteine O-methyltransferase Ste14
MAVRLLCTDVLSRIGFDIGRFTRSSAYDLAMRVPVIAWSSALALTSAAGLEQYIAAADSTVPSAVFVVQVTMRLSVIAYLVILAVTVMMRAPPIGRPRGAEPRISAFIGTFLITAVIFFPRHELSLIAGLVSSVLILAGDGLAVLALMQMRRSFSIMPEARKLVFSGLYRLVRHPLYLAEGIATIGGVMQFLSIWTVTLLLVQMFFQFRRIQNEEAVLMATFPQYAAYRKKTSRLIPGIY